MKWLILNPRNHGRFHACALAFAAARRAAQAQTPLPQLTEWPRDIERKSAKWPSPPEPETTDKP